MGTSLQRRKGFNPKRRIAPAAALSPDADRAALAQSARYEGNPEHKGSPNDYGLTPPADPRPGKTLCDASGSFPKTLAQVLLKSGFHKGMVSEQQRNGWPQNVWAVSDQGVPYEAELENRDQGAYHGYPMPLADSFRQTILEEWERR